MTAPQSTRTKKIVITAAVLLVLAGAAVVLTPIIASQFVPGIVESKAGEAIAGGVKVGSASLSWTGPQKLAQVQLLDPERNEVARLDVVATTSLLSVLRGSYDIGEVTIGGKALIVRDVNGLTNLQRATAAKSPASSTGTSGGGGGKGGAQVPAGLRAKVTLTNLDVTFADEAAIKAGAQYSMVTLPNMSGEAQIGAGQPTVLSLKSDVNATAGSGAGSGTQTAPLKGTFSLNGTIDNLIAADGQVQADKAKADIKVRATSLPVAVIDLLAGQEGRLVRGLGASLDLASDIKGDYNAGTATFTVATTNRAAASGTLQVKNGVLTSDTPITAAIPGTALVELVPGLRDAVGGKGGLELTSFPDATLRLESVVLKLPKDGLDLRGSGLVAQLQTAPIEGMLKVDGQSPRRVNITGLEAKVASLDFGGDTRAVIKCNATVDGESGGLIDTDITLGGLLDAKGAFKKGMPGKLDGRVTIRGASTAIIDPFVRSMKILPREDIGQMLNAEIVARTPQDAARGGYDVEIKVGSDRLSVDGAFAVSETSIKSIMRPFSARVLAAGAIAHRFLPKESWHLNPTGAVDVVVKDLDIPLVKDAKTGATSINMAAASGGIAARLFGFEIAPPPGTPQAVTLGIRALDVGMAFAAKATPRFTMSGDMSAGKDAFSVEADLALEGLTGPGGLEPGNISPLGRIAIKSVPTSLASMFNPATAANSPPVDLAAIAQDLVGPTVTITTHLAAARGKQATDVSTAVTAAHSSMTIEAQVSGPVSKPTALEIKTLTGEVNLQPTALDSLLRTFMPDLRERPQLVDASQIKLSVDPVSIPLAQGQAVDLSKLGIINAKVQIPGRVLVRGLTRTDAAGKALPVAPAGVENLELTVKAPASIGVSAAKVDVGFKARLLSQDAPEGTLASVQGSAMLDLAAPPSPAAAAGAKDASRFAGLVADVKIANVAAAALDTLNGTPGMMSGLLGEYVSADLKAKVESIGAEQKTITLELTPKAPRLAVSKPIRVKVLTDRITLEDDTKFDLQVDPAFVNGYLFKPDAAGNLAARLLKPTPVSVTISKLSLSRDASGKGEIGPLKAGIFELKAGATVAGMPLELQDGQQLTLGNTSISASADKAGGPIAFNVQVESSELKMTPNAPAQSVEKFAFSGTVDNLADANGKPSAAQAVVNAAGNIPAFPTAVLDALAKQGGLLNDALGPIMSVNLKAERVQLGAGPGQGTDQRGLLEVQMDSPRATLRLKGTVQNGTFTTTVPAEVTIIEITPELSNRVSKNIPFIGAISKTKELKPGLIRATNLVAPMDGDLSKLSADITVDLGEALVAPGGLVNELLSIKVPALTGALDKTGLSDAKKVGERLKPVSIAIRKGVMAYDAFKLPLGEFEIENSGSIDLAKREVDSVVWIPLGRLAAEAVPGLNTGINKIPILGDLVKGSFDELTMIPFRISGNMDGKMSRDFSPKLFAERVGKTVQNGAGIGDALKGIGDLFKNDKEKK